MVTVVDARVVLEVSEADAHVVVNRTRNGDGDHDAENGMGHGNRVEIAIADKEQTGSKSPTEGSRNKNVTWHVRHGKEERGCQRRHPGARQDAEKSHHKK